MKLTHWITAIALATAFPAGTTAALQDCSDVDSTRGRIYSKSLGNDDVGASFYAGARTLHYSRRCTLFPLPFAFDAMSTSSSRLYGQLRLADRELNIGVQAKAYKSASTREAYIEVYYLGNLFGVRVPYTDRRESTSFVRWNESFPVSVFTWSKTVWAGPIPFTVALDANLDFSGDLAAGLGVAPSGEARAYTTAQASSQLSVDGRGGVGIDAANVSVIFDGVLLHTALSSSLGATFPSGIHDGPGGTLEIRPWELRLKVCGTFDPPFFGPQRYCAVDMPLTGSSTTTTYQL